MRKFLFCISLSMLLPACAGKQTASSTLDEASLDEASKSETRSSGLKSDNQLEIPNRAEAIEGITTSAQPDRKTLERLDEHGFSTVINLRTAGEQDAFDEEKLVEAQGLTYVNIPISGPQDLTRQNAERLHEALETAAPGKILLHCSSSNRVGALLALRAHWLQGKTTDEALALGRSAGLTKLEPAVVERLKEVSEADALTLEEVVGPGPDPVERPTPKVTDGCVQQKSAEEFYDRQRKYHRYLAHVAASEKGWGRLKDVVQVQMNAGNSSAPIEIMTHSEDRIVDEEGHLWLGMDSLRCGEPPADYYIDQEFQVFRITPSMECRRTRTFAGCGTFSKSLTCRPQQPVYQYFVRVPPDASQSQRQFVDVEAEPCIMIDPRDGFGPDPP